MNLGHQKFISFVLAIVLFLAMDKCAAADIDFVTIDHKQVVVVNTQQGTTYIPITKEEMAEGVDAIMKKVCSQVKCHNDYR